MSDNELLLAISSMMDTKLKAELQPLKNDLQDVKTELRIVKDDVQDLKVRVQRLEDRVQKLEDSVQRLDGRVQKLEDSMQRLDGRVQKLEGKVQKLEDSMLEMKTDLQNTKEKVQKISLFQENVLLPRLNTIESCYTTTYHRYKAYADRIETALLDIELLKTVVSEHSEQLRKLA